MVKAALKSQKAGSSQLVGDISWAVGFKAIQPLSIVAAVAAIEFMRVTNNLVLIPSMEGSDAENSMPIGLLPMKR